MGQSCPLCAQAAARSLGKAVHRKSELFALEAKHTKLRGVHSREMGNSILTVLGEAGAGPTQGCAEGAQGSSGGMRERGNAFVTAAAACTVYNPVSQLVKR